jgi:hypothetical protein
LDEVSLGKPIMVNIQIDDQTAKTLEAGAANAGVSVSEYVKLIAEASKIPPTATWEEIEKELVELSVDGYLPDDFSRADIYLDHD